MLPEKNTMILANDQYYSLDCHKTQLNNNVLVVGCSGAGKTRSIVTPNLLQATGSYVVSDPKGNLYKQYGNYLRKQGYTVKCLDFVNPERSVGYNPLEYIRNSQDIVKMAYMLVYNSKHTGARSVDPFWDEASALLVASLIGYIMETCEEWRLEYVLKILCKGKRSESRISGGKNALQCMMDEHQMRYPGSWACREFAKADVASDRTFNSMLITLTATLGNLSSKEINKMLSKDEIDISSLGRKKTVLFVVVSDTDRSMDTFVNLFFTQAMNELCRYADEKCPNSTLPDPVRYILDDFATNCRIAEFPRMISSIRSRGISAMLMVQSEGQLEEGYGADGKTIISNCDTYIYLGGNDTATATAIAERSDLPLCDILNMPVGYNWLFRRGQAPFFNRNFNLEAFLRARKIVPDRLKGHSEKCAKNNKNSITDSLRYSMMSKEETEEMYARWMAEEFDDDGLACIASIEDDEE